MSDDCVIAQGKMAFESHPDPWNALAFADPALKDDALRVLASAKFFAA
ncbi:MAG: hypothetical protein ACLPID_03230 [Beijerinckiaceae bacterium]